MAAPLDADLPPLAATGAAAPAAPTARAEIEEDLALPLAAAPFETDPLLLPEALLALLRLGLRLEPPPPPGVGDRAGGWRWLLLLLLLWGFFGLKALGRRFRRPARDLLRGLPPFFKKNHDF